MMGLFLSSSGGIKMEYYNGLKYGVKFDLGNLEKIIDDSEGDITKITDDPESSIGLRKYEMDIALYALGYRKIYGKWEKKEEPYYLNKQSK